MKIIVDKNSVFTLPQLANTLAEERGWIKHTVKDNGKGDWEIAYTDAKGVPHKLDCGFYSHILDKKGREVENDHDQDVDLSIFVKWPNIVQATTEKGKTIFIHD